MSDTLDGLTIEQWRERALAWRERAFHSAHVLRYEAEFLDMIATAEHREDSGETLAHKPASRADAQQPVASAPLGEHRNLASPADDEMRRALEADREKLIAMGADPGPRTLEEACAPNPLDALPEVLRGLFSARCTCGDMRITSLEWEAILSLAADLQRAQDHVISMGDKLTRIVNAIRGEPRADEAWSTHDAAELVEAVCEGLRDADTVCICGCPSEQHEYIGPDDGEQCENEDHQCLRVAAGVAAMFAHLRADNALLLAKTADRAAIEANLRTQLASTDALLLAVAEEVREECVRRLSDQGDAPQQFMAGVWKSYLGALDLPAIVARVREGHDG